MKLLKPHLFNAFNTHFTFVYDTESI